MPVDRPTVASGRGGTAAPRFGLGASLYPVDAERSRPDDWYRHDVGPDLDRLAQAGCGLVRIFASWRVIEPQVGRYDEEALDRLREVVAAIGTRGMRAIVCLFADDRHSELSSVNWAAHRDPRTDEYLIERERMLVASVAVRLRAEKSLFAWQLGNEAFLSGFTSSDDLEAWVDAVAGALREQDPHRAIGFGGDSETLARTSGIDARAAAESCDFAVAHTTSAYLAYQGAGQASGGSASYLEAFLLRLARRSGPVLLDETGPIAPTASVGEEAASLRLALYSALCNRAAGAMVRRVRDMSIDRREPYFLDPFETPIGVLDESGVAKPALDELRAFAEGLDALDLGSYALPTERAAVLMPAERFARLPDLGGLHAPRGCFQAFVTASRAHVPTTVIDEGDDLDGLRLVIVPGARKLADKTWDALATFVQAGGTLVASYGGGEAPARFSEIFGLDFLGDDGPRFTLSCRIAQPGLLGGLTPFDVTVPLSAYARVSAGKAAIAATDEAGGPLATLHRFGRGSAVFLAAPIERALASSDPWAVPAELRTMLTEIYRSVAEGAGCGSHLHCDVPEVEVALFSGEDDDVAVLVNHADRKLTAQLVVSHSVSSIEDLRGGAGHSVGSDRFEVRLGPCGVAVLRLVYGEEGR